MEIKIDIPRIRGLDLKMKNLLLDYGCELNFAPESQKICFQKKLLITEQEIPKLFLLSNFSRIVFQKLHGWIQKNTLLEKLNLKKEKE